MSDPLPPDDADDTTEIVTEEDPTAVESAPDPAPSAFPVRRSRTRGLLAAVGVFVSCVLVVGAALGIWADRSFLQTQTFTDRAGSLVDRPEVRSELSAFLAAEINQLIDAEQLIADALPDEGRLLAVPLAGAVNGFVEDRVRQFVDSDEFAALWKRSVEFAHGALTEALSGDSELFDTEEDAITINLLPIVNAILVEIVGESPQILGEDVELSEITIDDVPDEARATIEEATGVDLDDDFGTIQVYDDGALLAAQQAVQLADRLVFLLVALAPITMAAAIVVSPRRRRTALQLCFGVVVSMVLVRRITFLLQDEIGEVLEPNSTAEAARAASEAFLDPLQNGAWTLIVLALAIAVVLWVTGPYRYAVQLRNTVQGAAGTAKDTVSERLEDESTTTWVADNRDALTTGGWIVGLLLVLFVDLSWLGLLVLLALVVGFQVAVNRLAGPDEPEVDPTGSDQTEVASST